MTVCVSPGPRKKTIRMAESTENKTKITLTLFVVIQGIHGRGAITKCGQGRAGIQGICKYNKVK
jgi:hypothetical protein